MEEAGQKASGIGRVDQELGTISQMAKNIAAKGLARPLAIGAIFGGPVL